MTNYFPGTVNSGLLWIIVGTFGALVAGTTVQLRRLKGAASEEVQLRLDSLRSWWIVAGAVTLAVVLGQLGVTLLMACVSWLSLREFFRLVGTRAADGLTIGLAFTLIPLHYGIILTGSVGLAQVTLPLLSVVLLGVATTLTGEVQGFVRATGSYVWGTMVTIYALSHAAMLISSSAGPTPPVGQVGLFVFLILLTESNDIAQALIGRRWGRRKITPVVSPRKTWEGFGGGVLFSLLCGALVGSWLLPSGAGVATGAVLGLAIALSGFLGDIHISALKRDVGVKDSSNLLPGQGGILDRIDSLTFTAPTFFYLTQWLFPA